MRNKFDAVEYLVKKYVEDGDHATIPVWLDDKEDFFSRFDPTDTALSPEIAEYLDHCNNFLPFQYKLELNIVCDGLTDKDKEKMKDAVKHYYSVKIFECDIDLKNNTRKSMILSMLGVVFVGLAYIIDSFNAINQIAGTTMNVFQEILLITGWVFIWSALENYVFDRHSLSTRKKECFQLFSATLFFENEDQYYKELKEEENEQVEKDEEIRDSFLNQ